MGKFGAVMRLTRIEHSLMLVIAVLAAELITLQGALPAPMQLAASLITPIFVSMAAFAINDYFDVEVDKKNGKKRPLVTGELSRKSALKITALCLIVGIAASVFINAYCVVIAVIFGGLALLYSYKLKEMLLLGNLYVAFSMVIPFIYGSYVTPGAGPGLAILLVSLMIFLSGLGREIHGTIRDLEGDSKERGVRSLPAVVGRKWASAFALLLYLAAVGMSVYLFRAVPPFLGNIGYAGLIVVSDIMLLYVAYDYLAKNDSVFYRNARNISLVAMGLALVAVVAAGLPAL